MNTPSTPQAPQTRCSDMKCDTAIALEIGAGKAKDLPVGKALGSTKQFRQCAPENLVM